MGRESIEQNQLGETHNKGDYTSTGHIHTHIAAGPYNGAEKPLEERVAADLERATVQLKAEHARELAALKADTIQKKADLKAEHAMTEGGTGFIAKLKGTEDPIKRAERKQLKAEIRHAQQSLKAEHDYENAELQAKKSRETAALAAAIASGDTVLHHNTNALPQSHAALPVADSHAALPVAQSFTTLPVAQPQTAVPVLQPQTALPAAAVQPGLVQPMVQPGLAQPMVVQSRPMEPGVIY